MSNRPDPGSGDSDTISYEGEVAAIGTGASLLQPGRHTKAAPISDAANGSLMLILQCYSVTSRYLRQPETGGSDEALETPHSLLAQAGELDVRDRFSGPV